MLGSAESFSLYSYAFYLITVTTKLSLKYWNFICMFFGNIHVVNFFLPFQNHWMLHLQMYIVLVWLPWLYCNPYSSVQYYYGNQTIIVHFCRWKIQWFWNVLKKKFWYKLFRSYNMSRIRRCVFNRCSIGF